MNDEFDNLIKKGQRSFSGLSESYLRRVKSQESFGNDIPTDILSESEPSFAQGNNLNKEDEIADIYLNYQNSQPSEYLTDTSHIKVGRTMAVHPVRAFDLLVASVTEPEKLNNLDKMTVRDLPVEELKKRFETGSLEVDLIERCDEHRQEELCKGGPFLGQY